MKFLNKIKSIPLVLFRVFSYLIPKKKGMLVFQQWHNQKQFSGNIKALVLYAKENYDNSKIYILAPEYKLHEEVKQYGLKSINNKLLIYWFLLRTEYLVTDATLTKYAGWNIKIVQLWHGTGFKNIGLLNDNVIDNKQRYSKFLKHFLSYKLVVATSEDDKERKEKSFRSSNVRITGSPRNDVFFNDSDFTAMELKKKYNLVDYDKIISYTPTFRDFETQSPFTSSFWGRLNDYLVDTNTIFIIKKHPWDKYLEVPTFYSNVKDLSKKFNDVQELLLITDMLISDYSGIVTDFAITGRPILSYMYDLEDYLSTCRTSYYNLDEILPKPFAYNENELFQKIIDDSWVKKTQYIESYLLFKNRFHKHLDGNSSERVMNEIINLIRK